MNKQDQARFTGRHMAAIMIGGFAVVIAVNLFMAVQATRTFGGVVVENSYVASQKFNDWLDRAETQRALGWEVTLSRDPQGRVLAETATIPAGGTMTGQARHPLGRQPNQALNFVPDGAGRWRSTAPVPAGRRIVRIEVTADGHVWRGEQTLS